MGIENKSSKKNKKWLGAIVIIIVIAMAAILGWTYYDNLIKTTPDENIQSLVDDLNNIEISSNISGFDDIDITKSDLFSDADNSAYKDALVDAVSNEYSISSAGYTVDKKTKSAEVKLVVTYADFGEYSDEVIKQLSDKLPDIIKQNLNKTSENSGSNENSNESLQILTDPLNNLAVNETEITVTLYYDKKSYDWLPTNEDIDSLKFKIKEFIGAGLNEQVNQIIDKSNKLDIISLLSEDDYKALINESMNKQLGTVKEIDYTEYIDAYIAEHPELFSKEDSSSDEDSGDNIVDNGNAETISENEVKAD